MISWFSRFVLFASSYAPLTLAFAVLYFKDTPAIGWALIVVCFASVFALRGLLASVHAQRGTWIEVERSSRKDTETLSYLATYLIPFALSPPRDVYAFLALMIFVVVLGYLYVTSNMIYVNPVLSLFGYHIYEVVPKDGVHSLLVLAKSDDEPPQKFEGVEIGHRIYVALS